MTKTRVYKFDNEIKGQLSGELVQELRGEIVCVCLLCADSPENCHLTYKKWPKTFHFFKKLPKIVIFFKKKLTMAIFFEQK